MNFDSRTGSRLTADARYWEDLAARSIDAAFDGQAQVAVGPWWRGMADASFALAACAALAVLGGATLLGDRASGAPAGSWSLERMLAPDDPLLGSFIDTPAESPPASVLLKLVVSREGTR